MGDHRLESVLQRVRHTCLAQAVNAVTDAELLHRFVQQRDAAAFELLLRRHERMVFGVCRHLLQDFTDAEDVFQATFLTLVCKAHSIARGESVAAWLHQVACRAARRAAARRARRRTVEARTPDLPAVAAETDPLTLAHRGELAPMLHEELNKLPDKYRVPLVLCYLEGKSYAEGARQLGCPLGTLSIRLKRGRDLLGKRLAGRGLVLTAGGLAAALSEQTASATVAAGLSAATLKAGLQVAGGSALVDVVSPRAAALTEWLLQTAPVSKLKLATLALVLALGIGLAGGWAMTQPMPAAPSTPPEPPAWRHVAAADEDFRPVFRFVALAQGKPADLKEEVAYRGQGQKYAQVRFGSDDSRRVVVVVDEVGRDEFDLYVDANRNRVIEAKEKLAGAGKERTGPLDVEITRGLQILHEPRSVQWRLGVGRKTISLATLGYVEGVVSVGGKNLAARRVDGNANGFFADAADRLWIDLNGDGRWDPIAEQFPFAPVLTLNDRRYGLRGDALGTRLAVEPLTSEGRIRLRLGELAVGASLLKIDVMLTGEDGSAFAVGALDTPTVLPAGRYAVGSVALSVQPAGGGQPLHFVFSRVGVDAFTRWHDLGKDQELTLDPVGKLRFGLEIDRGQLVCKPGEVVRVQPQLFTADGLVINSCSPGESEGSSRYGDGPHCLVKLTAAGTEAIDVQSSGFV